MTNAKHTPGPWEYTPYTDHIRADHSRHWTIAAMVEMQGCADPSRDIVAEEKIANARLIAAAPELLESAKMAVAEAVGDGFDDWYVALKEAIAKAEGRG